MPVALRAARAGARVLTDGGLPRPGGVMDVKGAGDYVTVFDRQSEAAILEVLAREAPGIAVLAEEAGGKRAGTMWAVDPLDGTTNFTRGFPVVAVSVGLLDDGVPVAGVVIAPFLGLEFAVSQRKGATLNGDPIPRMAVVAPSKAIVATGLPFRKKERMRRYQPVLEGAFRQFEDLRRAGAAALDLAWTATGTFDGYFELNLSTWDLAAGAALLLEVGGRVTDWSGGNGWVENGDILAASPAVHEVLLKLTQESLDR